VFVCTAVTGLGFYYLATFVVTFLTVEVQLPKSTALQIAVLGLMLYALLCPVAGLIADRIGRR
jgi:MHS family proline/betaine transporter-like MFS transporter